MSPRWATFLFEVANFLLLAVLLGWLFFRPVRDALERRRVMLQAEQQELAKKRAEAEHALHDLTAKQRELEGSLATLREQVRQEAERERARMLEEARAQAQRERETLQTELAALRRQQATGIARDAAAAASEMVRRLLQRIDGPDLERGLFEAARRELAQLAGAGSVAPVLVEAPRELEPERLATLAAAAGVSPLQVTQRTVPELVAGIRILTARGLVDASVSGLAGYAERTLLSRVEREGSGGD